MGAVYTPMLLGEDGVIQAGKNKGASGHPYPLVYHATYINAPKVSSSLRFCIFYR